MRDLVLYSYFRSSTSYRVRIALHWKGLEFEYRPVHLLNNGGEQFKDEYRAVNPAAEVPSLLHNGKTIAQSMAILEYLEEVFPSQPLLPKTHELKAKIRQFCENINCTHPLQNLKTLAYLQKILAISDEQKQQWLSEWIGRGLQVAEKLATSHKGQYAMSDEVTLADVFLVPQIFSAQRFNVETKAFPKLLEINERCLSLPAFKKAHPFRQPDTPADLRLS